MVFILIASESDICILNDALKIISKKWTAFIFCQLLDHETMSFNELLDQLSDRCGKKITASVLSQTLKELEEHNLLSKKIIAEYIPVRTEYQLTTKGKELRIIYGIIKQWATKWFTEERHDDINKFTCCVFEVLPEIQSKVNTVLDLSTLMESS